MSSPDIHTLTGAYAMDALDEQERAQFEDHLAGCEACRLEVAELQATAARLAIATAMPPPADLRARVLAAAAASPQLSPVLSVRTDPPRVAQDEGQVAEPDAAPVEGDSTPIERQTQASEDGARVVELPVRRARSWLRQPAAAAAALFLVVAGALGGLAVSQNREADRAKAESARIFAIATDPDRFERTIETSGGSGTVVAADGEAVFRGWNLPVLAEDETYQLWVIDAGGPASAGVLGSGGVVEALVGDADPGDSIGLTVEPAGGSDAPTSDPVLVLPLA